MNSDLEEVRDMIATAHAMIDQAEAHYQENKHLFTRRQRKALTQSHAKQRAHLAATARSMSFVESIRTK